MDDKEYQLISEVQDEHWWWLGRQRIIRTIIERHVELGGNRLIADVGCGLGGNLSLLSTYGDVIGLEPNDLALKALESNFGGSAKFVKWKSPDKLPFRFDFMLAADVLEHIPDDKEAVAWIHEHLQDGGYALLTVPAHRLFWTEMDDIVHHHRRYGRRDLLALFGKQGGFKIVRFTFYNFFLLPVKVAFVLLTRLLRLFFPQAEKRSYNETPPWLVNTLFKQILYFEARLLPYVSLPTGVGMILLVQKTTSHARSPADKLC